MKSSPGIRISGLRGIHSELSFAPNRYLGSIITQFGDEEICRQVRQIIDNALKDITPDELEARLDSDRVDQLTKMVASTIIPTYEELKMYVSARVKNAHQSAEQLIEDCELIARSVHKRQRILRSTRNITNWFFDVFFPVTYGLMAMIFAVWPTGLTALVGTLASWLPER